MEQKTLLAVLAHPDDESFGMGGTLAYYASRDVEVHLICATRGEVGDVPQDQLGRFSSVAELREAELRCAAETLGLKGVHFLGYRDSGMEGSEANRHEKALAAQPLDEVAGKIALIMRQLRPQVVLTFDPVGGYRHPDHIAIQRATVRAFELAGDPAFASDHTQPYQPQGLFFHVYPRKLLKLVVKLMPLFGKDPRKFGKNGDIDMTRVANDDFPAHVRINIKEVLDKKKEAAACHASQGGGQAPKGLIAFAMRWYGSSEYFMQARPPVRKGRKKAGDFFTTAGN